MSSEDRVQCKVTLPLSLSKRLDELVAVNAVTRSAIVADALQSWLRRKGDDELELRFAPRLDRMSRQLGRIERNTKILLEGLALFVLYMLTVNAPLPENDEVGQAIGRDRFEAFMERVGRRVGSGRITFLSNADEPKGEGK